jgi:hypothetical protein
METELKYIRIVPRKWLKQKYYALFIADNGKILAVTEHYHNLSDLERMLEKYYPDWPIEISQ